MRSIRSQSRWSDAPLRLKRKESRGKLCATERVTPFDGCSRSRTAPHDRGPLSAVQTRSKKLSSMPLYRPALPPWTTSITEPSVSARTRVDATSLVLRHGWVRVKADENPHSSSRHACRGVGAAVSFFSCGALQPPGRRTRSGFGQRAGSRPCNLDRRSSRLGPRRRRRPGARHLRSARQTRFRRFLRPGQERNCVSLND